MKKIILSALLGFTLASIIFAIAITRPIKPDESTLIGALVCHADEPITSKEQLSDSELNDLILAKLPTTERVDYEKAIEHLQISYDDSIKTQFFIRYSYSTYQNSKSKLFFDAQVHNQIVKQALGETINEVLINHHAKRYQSAETH